MSYKQKGEIKKKLKEKIDKIKQKISDESELADSFFKNQPKSFHELFATNAETQDQNKDLKTELLGKKNQLKEMLSSLKNNPKYF